MGEVGLGHRNHLGESHPRQVSVPGPPGNATTDGALSVAMAQYRFWVHALPTPEMTIYVAWPAHGLDERSLIVDGSSLVAALGVDTRVAGW